MSIYILSQTYASTSSATQCMFCLETEDTLTTYMPCQCRIHVHTLCLNTWLAAEASCPLCRSELHVIQPELLPPTQTNSQRYMKSCIILTILITTSIIAVYFYISNQLI